MPQKTPTRTPTVEALVRGTPEEIEHLKLHMDVTLVVAAPNGAFATELSGPSLIRQLAKTLGQDKRKEPDWDGLTQQQKIGLLSTASGNARFVVTGLAPTEDLAKFAEDHPELIKNLFPRYAQDSTRCQLGLLEGCDTNGTVEAHLPSSEIYACIKCLA